MLVGIAVRKAGWFRINQKVTLRYFSEPWHTIVANIAVLFSILHTMSSPGENSHANAAAWLAQLVERRTAVREVEGSCPRPDQHSGS